MSEKKGRKYYSPETKKEAIRLFYEEGKTRLEIVNILELSDKQRVKKWVNQYRKEGPTMFTKHVGRPYKNVETQEAEIDRLRMENSLLKKLQSELRKDTLARHNIGQSITTRTNSK